MSEHSRTNPFLATVKERYSLCGKGTQKQTQHVVLDIAGSGITYQVGDSIGIYPQNDPKVVQKTLAAMKADGSETVLDRHAKESWTLRDFLTIKANIAEISKKLFTEIGFRQSDSKKKKEIEDLHLEENKEHLKYYLEQHHLWDILEHHQEVEFSPQELCNLLMPLLPRLYSISSAQNVVGDEVHLTVALLEYESSGHYRRGVCTHYLCELAPMQQPVVPVYIQKHHGFTLPENHNAPIIMVGPGTGVAPFRAFMQERMVQKAPGDNWLFFGEWHRDSCFFYRDFWEQLVDEKKLRLDVAFSRDQLHKIYVQNRMLEHGDEIYRWIEQGGYFYVCGDAQQMAKGVEAALLEIIQKHGHLDEAGAKQYLKQLRNEKRYLRDVY